MKYLLALIPFSLGILAQNITPKQIAQLKGKTDITYDDLAHENQGCPENSLCSKEMGIKMKRWKKFMEKMASENSKRPSRAAAKIESFRAQYGLPVAFLADKESVLSIDPILFSSRCAHHNPKEKSQTTYKAIQFFKNNPASQAARFDPATLYEKNNNKAFLLPYEETPIMIDKGALVLSREHEDFFYHLAIDKDGKWKVVSPKKSDLSKALENMENAECPKELVEKSKDHLKMYCKKIWNADEKKAQVVRLAWACP